MSTNKWQLALINNLKPKGNRNAKRDTLGTDVPR